MQKPKKDKPVKESKTVEVTKPTVFFYADKNLIKKLFGADLEKIKNAFNVSIDISKDRFTISSETDVNACRKACFVLEEIFNILDKDAEPTEEDIDDIISEQVPKPYKDSKYKGYFRTFKNEEISPRTENQELIIDFSKKKTITVVHGSAGTGKTKILCTIALKLLLDNRFEKIVVFKPLTVVGKDIGFLPGTIESKIMPMYANLYETFCDLIGEKELELKIKEKKIVFNPIGTTRGINVDHSIMIIDEAQNTTKMEMLTLLTRISNSKVFITGDVTQQDLKFSSKAEKTGLDYCIEKLQEVEQVGFVKMNENDIQRSKIVSEIIRAFE